MADPKHSVKEFLGSLKPGRDGKVAPRADLLTEDVIFQTLGKITGRESVIKRMSDEASGRPYREMAWAEPVMEGSDVKITGKLPAGSPMGGVIIVFRFAGDRISAVLQQPLPGAPTAATELKLSPELRKLVDTAHATGYPIIVAHVDGTGQPILSYRGSTQSFSDNQLAIWVRNSDGNFLNSIAGNPKLALMYRNSETRAAYQFQGRAHVSTDEAARNQIYRTMTEGERNHDYARTGVALIIELDRVEGWAGVTADGQVGKVRMLRGAGK